MKVTIIITSIFFIYILFSTIFHNSVMVGGIGQFIADANFFLFGHFSYINIIILLYPLYKLYKDPSKRRDKEFYIGWILFFMGLVLFNSLILEFRDMGFVGRSLIDVLNPLIGKAGLWLFWIMIMALSFVFLVDDEFDIREVFHKERALQLWDNLREKIKSNAKNPFVYDDIEDEMPLKREKKPIEVKLPKKRIKAPIPPNILVQPMGIKSKPIEHIDLVNDEVEEAPVIKKSVPIIKKAIKKEPIKKEIIEEVLEEEFEIKEVIPTVKKPKKERKKAKKIEQVEKIEIKNEVEIVTKLEENSKLLEDMERGTISKPNNFKLPKLSFLEKAPKRTTKINEAEIDRKIADLLAKLKHFKVEGDVVRTYTGPLVTTFEFKPAPNVKVSKVLNLQDDLAMALSAETIRIQAPIPGRDVMGIEIPNDDIETIYLREILESEVFQQSSSPLTVALGKDIVGNPFVTDIKKLPHILIAGTTGSGKSVGINAMILSLLYRNDPDHLKLMLIDPKMLEFSIYNDIPHLLTPVIIEPKKAIYALANMVSEMERRYKLMSENRTKNIDNYNDKVLKDGSADPFPFIVVVIDELADLMMNGGKEVEYSIARLAQMARASGIHLIVATQRPSVDVVTGLIKANLPSRLSYRVGQRIDSKVILDTMGAESLLGRGDGLFTPPATTGLVRLHAPWSSETEVEEIVEFLKAQRLPEYDESYLEADNTSNGKNGGDMVLDELYEEAKRVVLTDKKTSISYLQRKLQIGYNRSANIIEQLQDQGVLSEPNNKGNREIV